MSAFVCEKCGADLRLSLPDRAYLCETSPKEHRFDRGDCEQAWLKEASAVVEAAPGDVDAVFQLASLCGRLASTSLLVGDPDPARVYMSQVVGVIELLYLANKDDERVRSMLLEALSEQAMVGEKLKDASMAAGAYERMLPLVEAQTEAEPKNVEHQRNLSVCLNGAGRMTRALGNGVAAKHYFERDLEVLEHLQELYPENTDVMFDRAVARYNLFLVSDVRAEELEHLKAVTAILASVAGDTMPDQAKELEARAKAELERINSTDEMAPSRLAKATSEVVRAKADDDETPTSQDRRAWLIERVNAVLRERRKRLPVVR